MSKTPWSFDKKWATYAVAGSAVVALPSQANAATINLTTELGPVEDFLDVNGDGTNDYRFWADSSPLPPPETPTFGPTEDPPHLRTTGVEGLGSNLIFGYSDGFENFATAFGPGAFIDGPTIGSGVFLEDKITDKGKLKGEWPNDLTQSRFLGLLFEDEGQQYKGWAEVSVELGSASLTVGPFAFVPANQPLQTPSVPEPGSMALMLLGAAGVAALKRRRG